MSPATMSPVMVSTASLGSTSGPQTKLAACAGHVASAARAVTAIERRFIAVTLQRAGKTPVQARHCALLLTGRMSRPECSRQRHGDCRAAWARSVFHGELGPSANAGRPFGSDCARAGSGRHRGSQLASGQRRFRRQMPPQEPAPQQQGALPMAVQMVGRRSGRPPPRPSPCNL